MRPWVTIVIPVHNSIPYLEDTLASAYHQSLDRERVEVIAVDDGSTDGSGELLATWAARWPQLHVVTQEASGAAGKPRNVGIERAQGDYLFFLDSDDCLAPEALERLLDYAHTNESDVVLARLVGIGRSVPVDLFKEDQPRAGLDSGIYYSLMPFKLVRRSLVMEHGIRFPEHIRVSEDQYFIAACYLAADVISILGSYPAYYLLRRQDASNLSKQGLPYATVVGQADETARMVVERTQPGPVQSHLLARHIHLELLHRFRNQFVYLAPDEQQELVRTAAPYARSWDVGGMDAELIVVDRLLLEALKREDVEQVAAVLLWSLHGQRSVAVHEDGRWFRAAPGFRDGYPDELFETEQPTDVTHVDKVELRGSTLSVSGHSFFRGIDSATCQITVNLHLVVSEEVVPMTVSRTLTPFLNAVEGRPVSYLEAGFCAEAQLDSDEFRMGRWRLALTLSSPDVTVSRNLLPPEGFTTSRSSWTTSAGVETTAVLRLGSLDNLVVGLKRPAPNAAVPAVDPPAQRRSILPRRAGRSPSS